MIETFKRIRLQQKGLSCGKKRRDRDVGGLRQFLTCSPVVTAALLGAVAIFLGWLVLARPTLGAPHVDEPTKAILVMMLLFLGGVLQFSSTEPLTFQRNSRLMLVFGLLAVHMGVIKAILAFVEDNTLAGDFQMLLLPLALAPMALTVLLGRGHGLFAVFFCSLWGCLMISQSRVLPWLVTSLATGLVAVAASQSLRKRQHFLRAGAWVGLTAFCLAVLFGHLQAVRSLAHAAEANWRLTAWEGAIVFAVNLGTGIVVSSVLPLIESTFRITTASSWMELADLNHPLLRRMTVDAPGTYHHSLMVANLSEAAAEAIGADSLMARVCAYFHDIGKIKNPEYFIENQAVDGNPHDAMAPSMSALVVISHVKDGVDLALRHKLNREIIDVIEQHHGTSLAWFFYNRALQKRAHIQTLADQDKAHETDVPEVEESNFRYPGPKPQFKESAIISLADALESASRSLEKPTPQKIEQLVDDIVNARVLDGQLDEAPLTLGELKEVKKAFVNTLRSMLHKRVAYTKAAVENKEGTSQAPGPVTQPIAPRFEVVRGPKTERVA